MINESFTNAFSSVVSIKYNNLFWLYKIPLAGVFFFVFMFGNDASDV